MTTLTITPDLAKKKMKLDGVIAAGEKIAVTVKGFGEKSATDTRLRVYCGKDLIAIYPKDPAEGEELIPWDVEGEDLSCELDLFTVQAEKATRFGSAPCLFILDDPVAGQLYATREHDVLKWIKRCGADIPYDLSGYPDIIASFRTEIDEFKVWMNASWAFYKSEIGDAWLSYKQSMQAQYDSFTQTVRGLVDGKASASDLSSHVNNKSNPHGVKIAQIPQLRSELDNLGAQITNESTARTNADNALRESVTAERDRAFARENKIASAVVGENQRAVRAETKLDLDIRQLGNRVDDAIHILRGKTYQRPTAARGWNDLLCEVIVALGGNIATNGIVPGTNPGGITLTADDGTVRSISIVKSGEEYTSIVR